MISSLWWNNLSVKHKLLSLVLLPVILLIFLAGQQVYRLSVQSQDLARAQLFSDYMDEISYLYNLSFHDITNNGNEIQNITQELNTKATSIFANYSASGDSSFADSNIEEVQQLLSSFEEASLSLTTVTDIDERLDISEWRADTYKQILLALEKVPFNHATFEIKSHLSSLIQLEWLMFWSREENHLSQYLIHTSQQSQYYDTEISSEIETLVQSQQLFLERFVTLNANQQQVSMLLETFNNDVFIVSQEFRASLLNEEQLRSLSSQEVATGLAALNGRLALLQDVDNKIEQQLRTDINHAITAANQQRLMFIGIMCVITILVIGLAIGLVRKVTGDLNLVIKFLNQDEHNEVLPLSELVKGKDELSQFAQEVEKLSYEREQARLKLTQAKEAAEKAKDEAIRASKAKSSFLANMSHEIRTPLNGVIGISEVLSDTPLSTVQRDYVNTIETSSQLLLSLINDILDFSKIESGMLISSPHSTCIRESIYDIASIIAPRARQKGIDLQVSISRNTPSRLMVDDHRLRQVIMNFMSNAVKFTTKGSVHLSVTCHSVTNSNAVLEFSVQDSGIGIEAQQQKKIFEPFAQEDESTTRQYGGTGLGLAICTQLIELMGSKVQLESQKGQGSRFFFLLDVAIEQMSYKSKHTINNSCVWLVCDDEKMTSTLHDELSFYHIDIYHSVNSLERLPNWNNNRGAITVIYVESSPNTAIMHVENFNKLATQRVHLCLLKHFNSDQVDFSENISAITQPLMGQRLLKALQYCENQYNTTTSGSVFPQIHSQTKPHILLVDDNTVNQKVAGLHVTKAGFSFDLTANGAEAVEMFKTNHYVAILMDCMMPVMDGFEATKAIRQIEQKENRSKPIPIIALTASIVDDDIQKCFDVGMDDYLAKPFKADVLKEKLNKVITIPHTPVKPSETAAVATVVTTKKGDIASTPNRPERVLLVEDNAVNQKVSSILLKKAGYQFEIAENGQIAVEMFQRDSNFDIILMDCMMPVMDGFEATKEIRKYEKSTGLPKTPIIALTASVVDDDIQRCYDSGMDAYVPKPVRKEKLLHQLENLVMT